MESRSTELQLCADIAEIASWREKIGARAPVAVDVPIGLLAHGGSRTCDTEARRLLGKPSSVFSPPGRYLFAALKHDEYEARWKQAQRLVAERQAAYPDERVVGVTRQTIGIIDKVAEVDAYLLNHGAAEDWLIECHPELSFVRMNGGAPLAKKTSARGQVERLDLVRREFPDVLERIAAWPEADEVSLVDIVDAYGALFTALRWARGEVESEDVVGLGAEGHVERDNEHGLPMRIVR